jgi:hypothetical protein
VGSARASAGDVALNSSGDLRIGTIEAGGNLLLDAHRAI